MRLGPVGNPNGQPRPQPRGRIERTAMNRFGTLDNQRNEPENYDSALGRAIALWGMGRSISMALAAELIEQGYDLPSLEARHSR